MPIRGFISGRAAQLLDVKDGNAVFVAEIGGHLIGQPVQISIPQYVYLNGPPRSKGILVQAEEANGIRIYGILELDGKSSVVTDTDIEFLGTNLPDK